MQPVNVAPCDVASVRSTSVKVQSVKTRSARSSAYQSSSRNRSPTVASSLPVPATRESCHAAQSAPGNSFN